MPLLRCLAPNGLNTFAWLLRLAVAHRAAAMTAACFVQGDSGGYWVLEGGPSLCIAVRVFAWIRYRALGSYAPPLQQHSLQQMCDADSLRLRCLGAPLHRVVVGFD